VPVWAPRLLSQTYSLASARPAPRSKTLSPGSRRLAPLTATLRQEGRALSTAFQGLSGDLHPVLSDVIGRVNPAYLEQIDRDNIVGYGRPWQEPESRTVRTRVSDYCVVKADVYGFGSLMRAGQDAAVRKALEDVAIRWARGAAIVETRGGDTLWIAHDDAVALAEAARHIMDEVYICSAKSRRTPINSIPRRGHSTTGRPWRAPHHCDDDVPRDGHDVLAPADGFRDGGARLMIPPTDRDTEVHRVAASRTRGLARPRDRMVPVLRRGGAPTAADSASLLWRRGRRSHESAVGVDFRCLGDRHAAIH